jgi:signal transduction histidine kinase
MTVLVVDDNAQNRALAQAALEDEGYTVVLAENGEQGIQAFQQNEPDCVLLDVRMPGMDGFVVCERLRELPGGKETPVLFLTALRDIETFDQALRVGGDDFLTKPIRPTELALRVQAALKLGKMSSELRDQYDIVRRQRDDLMRLQLQKEQLTAFVVHDLKNPVNAIDLHAQLLVRNRDLPASARSSAQQVRDEVRSLMRLIMNLLDIAKSEQGRLSPRLDEIDTGELVSSALEALELRARAKRVRLTSAIEASSLKADPDLMRRVLENLIDNAIRHAPEDSEVRFAVRRADGHVELRVSDGGPGIPKVLRDKVFDQFVQVESATAPTTRTGRGLGLAFCKLAVEAHGGTISVSDGAPGAIFTIRLPETPA